MIADAIKDVSSRTGIVLDLFGGSGSTLIAAHKTGRRGYLCELDPLYCDRIIRRWQVYARDDAVLESSGESFKAVAKAARAGGDCHATAGAASHDGNLLICWLPDRHPVIVSQGGAGLARPSPATAPPLSEQSETDDAI